MIWERRSSCLWCSADDSDWFYHSAATCRSPLAHHGNSLSHLIRYLIHNKSILISFMFGGRRGGWLSAVHPPSSHHPQLFSAVSHLHTWYRLICWLLSADYWWRGSGCVCIKDVPVLFSSVCFRVDLCVRKCKRVCCGGGGVKHVLKLLLIKGFLPAWSGKAMGLRSSHWLSLCGTLYQLKFRLPGQTRWTSGYRRHRVSEKSFDYCSDRFVSFNSHVTHQWGEENVPPETYMVFILSIQPAFLFKVSIIR